MNRRSIFIWLVRGIGLSTAAIVGVPALLSLISPAVRQRRGTLWAVLGPIDEFAVGSVEKRVVQLPEPERTRTAGSKGVFVWRRSTDEVVVYSRNCTDLSCPITWDRGSGWYYCPCHGGIFNQEGEPVAGPPSIPLLRYRTRVRDGRLEIDLHSLPPMT